MSGRNRRKLGQGCESLEQRRLLAADVGMDDGFLSIQGTDQADAVDVWQEADQLYVQVQQYGEDGELLEQQQLEFPAASVKGIYFDGKAGNDVFINDTDRPAIALGGDGDDILIGGRSADTLAGNRHDDFLAPRSAGDVLLGSGGDNAVMDGIDDEVAAAGESESDEAAEDPVAEGDAGTGEAAEQQPAEDVCYPEPDAVAVDTATEVATSDEGSVEAAAEGMGAEETAVDEAAVDEAVADEAAIDDGVAEEPVATAEAAVTEELEASLPETPSEEMEVVAIEVVEEAAESATASETGDDASGELTDAQDPVGCGSDDGGTTNDVSQGDAGLESEPNDLGLADDEDASVPVSNVDTSGSATSDTDATSTDSKEEREDSSDDDAVPAPANDAPTPSPIGGNDIVVGGAGNDWVFGGDGDDWLFGDSIEMLSADLLADLLLANR